VETEKVSIDCINSESVCFQTHAPHVQRQKSRTSFHAVRLAVADLTPHHFIIFWCIMDTVQMFLMISARGIFCLHIYIIVSIFFISTNMGQESVAGIATRDGLDGPGIESRWGRDFPHLSRTALVPTHTPAQWIPGYFPGAKRRG
jgi:hypothetical protein